MIDPRPDGTTFLDLEDGSEKIRLRRPKYGEYKHLQLSLASLQDENERDRSALQALADEAEPEDEDGKTDLAERRKKLIDETEQHAIDGITGWWREVVHTLGSRPLPDSIDDWPIELVVGGAQVGETIRHWRTDPLDRGQMGQPTPQI